LTEAARVSDVAAARAAAPAPASRGARWPARLVTVGKGAAGFVVLAGLWEAARHVGVLPAQWVPSVWAVLRAIVQGAQDGTWARTLGPTLFAWLVGLGIAIVLGAAWGCLAGASPLFRAGQSVITSFLRAVPAIALVPVAILAFGLRPTMVISLVVFGCVWPMLFNTFYAFREIPEHYRDTARMLGYGRVARFLKVEVVATLPGIFTGIRIAASIGLVITVSTEVLVGSTGLGGYIMQQRSVGQMGDAYAGIVIGGILGVLAGLIGLLQRRLLAWSPDNRRAEA
jgi:NitT/TauT family transport system permease protein